MSLNPYAHFSGLQRERENPVKEESSKNSERIPSEVAAEIARDVRKLFTQAEKMDAIRPGDSNGLAKRVLRGCYDTIHSVESGSHLIKESQEAKAEAGQEETPTSTRSFR